MKKFLFLLLAAASLFCACKNDETKPDLNVALTNDMVQVNVTGEYLVVVDPAAKTISVELSYEDIDELQALEVSFVGLPSGVVSESFTFDFSGGATREVVFTKDGAEVVYIMSASAADPDPHFVSVALNDVEVSGGTVKLSGSTDLSAVKFDFSVAPEGTKVFAGDKEIASGDEVDFSDKVNGVTFTLKCGDVEKTETIKVTTTGISSVKRVWGHYVKPVNVTDTWFGTDPVPASGWERNIAMDDKYVYVPQAGGKNIFVLNNSDGSLAKTLTSDSFTGGVHVVSDAEVMDNGSSSVLLVCNMVNAVDSHLKVYAYDNIDADARVVLDYTLTTAVRLGDKFSVEGDWADGRLLFVNYNGEADRSVYVFKVSNGVISPEPEILHIGAVASGNSICGLYKYSDSEYMFAGTGTPSHVMSVSGGSYSIAYTLTDGARFSYPMHDVHFFTFNEQNYMTYTRLLNSFANGAVKIQEVNSETLAATMESVDTSRDMQCGLGDPEEIDITADKNGNGCGALDMRVIDGKTYIAGCVLGTGIVLFELE